MRSGNSKAHGTHTFCAMSVPVRTSPYQSVLHCPLHVHCAMCSASQKRHVLLNFRGSLAVWSVGWRCALRRADTAGAGIRTSTDYYGLLRTMVTWCSECHVLLNFRGSLAVWSVGWQSTLRRADTAGKANWEYWEYQEYWGKHEKACEPCTMEFPEHMAHSIPQTIYSIPSIRSIHSWVSPHPVHCAMRSASQWECALEFPEHMAHSMPCAIQSIMSIMSIMSIYPASTLCSAPCALPAGASALCSAIVST